jgi:hypothetical protein|tara:strand:- start:175 stop:570 length:396 start_codon:yes stop_codon:yes gene_type:complete
MAKNLRDHVVIIATLEAYNEGSVSGSGPSYTVTYDSGQDISAAQVGHFVYVEKRTAGAGTSSTVASTYVYLITAITDGEQPEMTLKYMYDTADLGDDSPADLHRGGGSSGSPQIADHKVVMVLGPAFSMFM